MTDRSRSTTHTTWLAVLLLGLALAPLDAAQADDLRVPTTGKIVVDGKADEAGWKDARVLPADPVDAPVPGMDQWETLNPRVAIVQSDGRLCVHVAVAEDPGPGMGVVVMIAQAGAETAADATTVAYRPHALRFFRYMCRGDKGVGRAVIPAEGAALWKGEGAWSLELAVGLDAVRPTDNQAPLLVSVLVQTRIANRTSAAPAGVTFQGPQSWARLVPGPEGWSRGATFDTARIAREDEADQARMAAWIRFLTANAKFSAKPPAGGAEAQVRRTIEEALFTPLEDARRHQPDLGPGIDVMEGDIYRQLGLIEAAGERYSAALVAAPGWREAHFGRTFFVDLHRWTNRPPTSGSNFINALAGVSFLTARGNRYRGDALSAASGILHYKRGDFAKAVALLEPIAARYPMHRVLAMTLERARDGILPFAHEQNLQKRDARLALPRVRLVTSRGPIVVELFQNDVPNAVNNFVWLAQQKFYDGVRFHQAIPFFMVQSGDPYSRDDKHPDLVGLGGPGYVIPAKASGRLPFRGALAMLQTGAGVAGSQFALLTGSALHTEANTMVIGRVVEGLATMDKLVAGDRIERVETVRLTEGWSYIPRTVAQEQPSKPTPSAPDAPGG